MYSGIIFNYMNPSKIFLTIICTRLQFLNYTDSILVNECMEISGSVAKFGLSTFCTEGGG